MTRRELLALPLAASAATQYRDYAKCLPDYLSSLAQRAYQRRNGAIAKLTTAAAINARQRWVRETFWRLAGGQPERTALNLRTTGEFTRNGYKVEKLLYESQPGLFVSANLYLPLNATGKLPGVLFQMGHSRNGKAWDSYQRCCQGLVQLGYVVLAFDPMGQGERLYYGVRAAPSADDEHTIPGRQMLLIGETATRMQVWDAVRSLDVLAAHPMVDATRLASTGQSGGGTVTMLLSAVDERLSCAAVCSGNTENFACAGFLAPGSTDDAEQNLIASGPEGFDRWDVLYPLAPKPLLVTVSARDFFGTYSPKYLLNGREEFDKLRAVYATLGHADRLAWADSPLPHGLSYATRLEVYNWFERWMKPDGRKLTGEPPVAPEKDETLWVTAKGRVPGELAGKVKVPAPKPGPDLAKLLSLDLPPATAVFSVAGKTRQGDVAIEAVEVPSAPHVWVPAWLLLPPTKARAVLLIADGRTRNRYWQEGSLALDLALDGIAVCAVDLRGSGDLSPELPRGAAGYASGHANEENFAWASLILGKPLAGQRTADLLAVIQALHRYPATAGVPLRLAASGKMTVPAIFAAALSQQVEKLHLLAGLKSYRSLVEAVNPSHPLANFVPGILQHTDLPEIVQSLKPRVAVSEDTEWVFETLRG